MRNTPVRFVAFSDFHAHNFTYGSKRVYFSPVSMGGPIKEGWYNSRFLDQILALQEMFEYVVDHNIGLVVFCGDLFHKRQQVSVDVANAVYKILNYYTSECDIELVMIPGNHDYADRDGHVHSLEPLTHFRHSEARDTEITVLDNATVTKIIHNVQFIPVPYTDDIDIARHYVEAANGHVVNNDLHAPYNVLLFHLGVQGAKVGGDYILINDRELGVEELHYKDFDLCLGGHYHQHQKLADNTYFVGALTQHNWGCAGGLRGFVDVKLSPEGHEVTRIETQAPKFWSLTPDMVRGNAMVHDTDFVRIRLPAITEDLVEMCKGLLCEDANIEFVTEGSTEALDLDIDHERMDPNGVLEAWIVAKNPELDRARLLTLGSNLLKEAQGKVL